MTKTFEPVVVKGAYGVKDLETGKVLDASKSPIRQIMIKHAYNEGQILHLDTVTGRARRLSPKASSKKIEDVGKLNFRAQQKDRDPDKMFANLEDLTAMVARGLQPSLVLTGQAGLGKTFVVKKTLKDMGLDESRDFVHFKGRATAAGLYITLYENYDKLIIFDDCDSIWKDDDAVNLLKAALDSYDARWISYISSKALKDQYGNEIEKNFEFKGKIIFITNINQNKLDPAIRSRSFVTDISLSTDQLFERMENLKSKMEPQLSDAAKDQALELMKELYVEYSGVEVNLRSFIKAARICQLGFEDPKTMIAEQIISPEK